MKHKLGGTGVALATPMNKDLSIDYVGLERLLNHILKGGIDYIVVSGTTGESSTCTWSEKKKVLEFVLEINNNRLPIVFGLGGNNTKELIEQASELDKYEIEAFLSVSPYYSKPSQEGILLHYRMLADSFPYPIILYNVPGRTASNVTAATTLALSKHDNIRRKPPVTWNNA
jgi:4-hydroxy-tetrahydrodipicolinate synthase